MLGMGSLWAILGGKFEVNGVLACLLVWRFKLLFEEWCNHTGYKKML